MSSGEGADFIADDRERAGAVLIPFVASAATAQTLAKAPRSVTTWSARAPRRSDRCRAEARQRHRPRSPARDLAGRLRRIAACAPRSGSATRKRDWRVSHDGQEASAIRRIIRFVISDIVECSDIARRSHLADPPFSARFRQGRERKKLTQAAVAAALAVSQSAVAQWESGRSFPSAGVAKKIEKLLGVVYQAAEEGQQAHKRRERGRLPIVGLPAPGDEDRILVDDHPHGEVVAPPQLEGVEGARAVYVRGRAMEPRYYPGEVVYLHPTRPANPGDFVFLIVKEPDFPTPVGYVRQYAGEDLVHIHTLALNPKRKHLVSRDNLVGMATIIGSGLL